MSALEPVRIGLVSVSDRASAGVYADQGLPALQDWLRRALRNPLQFEARLIPDERERIGAGSANDHVRLLPGDRLEHRAALEASGELVELRGEQARQWLWTELREGLVERFVASAGEAVRSAELDVVAGRQPPTVAADELLDGAP